MSESINQDNLEVDHISSDYVKEDVVVISDTSMLENEQDYIGYSRYYDPISMALYEDPVFTSDGHTYERSVIAKWFAYCKEQGKKVTSPLTNLELKSEDLITNNEFRS
eukprot:gene15907-21078_t